MAVYHQMGHHSRNLLSDSNLYHYKGAILSPTNETLIELKTLTNDFVNENFEFLFDPQLYFPRTNRGVLSDWSYFPSDFDTVDQSFKWWGNINSNLINSLKDLKLSGICSPAIIPRSFPNSYYEANCTIWSDLNTKVDGKQDVYLTLIVRLSDLAEEHKIEQIASIISGTEVEKVYLIFLTDVEPRRELKNSVELYSAMKLISYLENSQISIIVGYTSSDIMLWKAAGATSCATGKFFNLRRFTPSRWDEETRGGGQIAYWYEESISSYIREADIFRLKNEGLISDISEKNPICKSIIENFELPEPKPWIALGWRQYMYWFADFEKRINLNEVNIKNLLKSAEMNWIRMDEEDILLDEILNDGSWIRQWRQAIIEFTK
jgi:hypothetical protein